MTLSNVIFIAGLILTATAVIVPLARAAIGNAYDAELKQLRVDKVDITTNERDLAKNLLRSRRKPEPVDPARLP
jgi:hypothetical protein